MLTGFFRGAVSGQDSLEGNLASLTAEKERISKVRRRAPLLYRPRIHIFVKYSLIYDNNIAQYTWVSKLESRTTLFVFFGQTDLMVQDNTVIGGVQIRY
jgi:hypothetical protein